jgi:hypothetical protein
MRNIFLIIPAVGFLSLSPPKNIINKEGVANHLKDAATVKLVYGGIMHGAGVDVNVGINVEMDTSIGIRYEVKYDLGVKSHTAFYYKFSNPHQVIKYDFYKHNAELIKESGPAKEPVVSVVGKDVIKNYSCTHLNHQNDDGNATQDYWMSPAVPGFAQVAHVLNGIDPYLKQMIINQSIFNWGGLVELHMKAVEKGGQTATFNLYLSSAQSGIPINLADFDPPSK